MACEGIVIGSVSLYFAKQLKQANKEIEELKSIIAKNQAANEKRFEVLFNFIDNLSASQQRQQAPQKQVRTVVNKQPKVVVKKQVKIEPVEVDKKVEIEEEEDEVLDVQQEVDLEEETRALLEEDVEEDIDA